MYKQQGYLIPVDHNRLTVCKFIQLIFCTLNYPIPSKIKQVKINGDIITIALFNFVEHLFIKI